MATKGNNQPGERSRVRLIFAEAEGSTAEIQQLVQSFAAAVRGPQQVVVYPQLPAAPPAALPAAAQPAAQPSLFDGIADEDAGIAEATPVVTTPKPPNGKGKRKFKSPTPVEGLEFTSGKMPLKQYMDEQSAEEHSKRYLAVAFWLKEYRGLEEIGADHVYSYYRALGWNVPDDVLSVFRGIKKQGWVIDGAAKGLFKINHIGEGQLKKIAA